MHRALGLALVVVALASPASAKTFLSQQDALVSAFGDAKLVRQTFFLSPEEVAAANRESGVEFQDRLVIRYCASKDGKIVGYAYFDAHRVRTLPETVMVVVRPDRTIERVEILSFGEPDDFLPKRRWLDQLRGRGLSPDLSLQRAIRPISGATLTGRAIVNASRKVLAIHSAIETRTAR